MWSNISAPKSNLKAAQVGQSSPPTGSSSQENGTNSRVGGAGSSPLMRFKHAICASHSTGYIYIHGGRFGNGLQLDDDVWRFDPHQNSWCQLITSGASRHDDKPPSLQEHTLVEYGDCLYLFGGQVSAASGRENSFWRLHLATCEWSSLNPMKMRNAMRHGAYLCPTNRRGHSALVYRDSMYIFGGYEDFRGSSSQLWQFDLLNERWELRNLSSTSACHPEPRHAHSAVLYQDSMYVYGGLSNLKPLGDLWRWSWRDKRWFRERTRGASPGPLHGHSAIQAFNSMFVFGGERHSGRPTRSLWRLNLNNLCWQKIRPKGPRPHPTTWHVAVANPMNALDETNYLIESSGCLDEDDQEPRQSVSSISDNCFLNSNNNNRATTMQTIRPDEQQTKVAQPAPVAQQPKVSASEYQLAATTHKSGKSRRKLRLNFLTRRDRQSTKAHKATGRHSSISASRSATQLAVGDSSLPEPEITSDNKQPAKEASQVVKVEAVQILDNLDSDIKQMFESSAIVESAPSIRDENVQLVKPEVVSPTPTHQLTRDSMTQSQLSSFQASYQTAREQLTSQSTLTITADQVGSQKTGNEQQQLRPAANPLAEVRQRRSMHQFNNNNNNNNSTIGHNSQRRNTVDRKARPKSEIVQSLIDRADAQIKDMYTSKTRPPLPAAPAQLPVAFNSDDPILGALQNHRMFDRQPPSKRASGSLLERRANLSRVPEIMHRYSSGAGVMSPATKRHTIHQTMTYYNLYFAESSEVATRTMNEDDNQVQPLVHNSDTTTSSSCTIRNNTGTNATTYDRTTPALIGVRDGRAEADDTDTGSVASSSKLQTVESRTLREEQLFNGSHDEQIHYGHHQTEGGALPVQAPSELGGDNTSMSFSSIAEFEEDDMLQYSSPTDMNERLGDQFEADHDEDMQLGEQERTGSPDKAHQLHQMAPQKSTSSGYDSLRSSPRAIAPTVTQGHCRTATIDSFALTTTTTHTSTSDSSAAHSIGLQLITTTHSSAKTTNNSLSSPEDRAEISRNQPRVRRSITERLFSKKPAKRRYWQLCMFVMGGKQQPIGEGYGETTASVMSINEPINIWRLYI